MCKFLDKHISDLLLPIPILIILIIFSVNLVVVLMTYIFFTCALIDKRHHDEQHPKRHRK